MVDIATGEIMRFELVRRQRNPGFDSGDATLNNQTDWHAAQLHAQQIDECDRCTGEPGLNPDVDKRDHDDDNDKRHDCGDDGECD